MPKRAPLHNKQPRRTGWQHDRIRGSRQERGYGRVWEKLRRVVLARDMHLCQVCASDGRVTTATEVDHIWPKAAGGTDEVENLQAICRKCHKRKTATEGRGGRDL